MFTRKNKLPAHRKNLYAPVLAAGMGLGLLFSVSVFVRYSAVFLKCSLVFIGSSLFFQGCRCPIRSR